MNFLSAAFILLLSLPQAQATTENIEGVIFRDSNAYSLQLRDQDERIKVLPYSPYVEKNLKSLSSGDLLVGSGYYSFDRKILHLTSIDFVGLRKLLGMWRSEQWDIFNFLDFSELDLYFREYPRLNIQYSIAPSADNKWNIFMTNQVSVMAGKLEVSSYEIKIVVYDNDTGEITRTFKLYSLANP